MRNELMHGKDGGIISPKETQEIAESLRKYMLTGGKEEEAHLVNSLNANPGIIQRFFPTEGQKSLQKMNSQRLAAMRANDTEIMNLHHDLYVEAVKVQKFQIMEIEKARAGAIVTAEKLQFLEKLNDIASEKVESIISKTSESRRRMNVKFLANLREHNEIFSAPDAKEIYEMAMEQTRQEMAAHMEVTEQILKDTVEAIESQANAMALNLKV